MRILNQLRHFGWIGIVLLIALWAVLSCDDHPTGPGTIREAPFYYVDIGRVPPRLYALHPSTGQIDSAEIAWQAREGITVSANGDRLYLADRNYITVVDTDSLHEVTTLQYQPDNAIGVSPDSKFIAVANGNGLTILRTEDYGVEFVDTLAVWNCEFSSDSKSVYCGCRGTTGVYYVDLADSGRSGECLDVGDGATIYVLATPDQSRLLLYKLLGSNLWSFEVYDVAGDSIIFRDLISPGAGQMVMSPDGALAFYTSPGTMDIVSPWMGFKVFDVEANRISQVIDDPDYFSGDGYMAPPKFLSVSPDSRWLGIVGSTRTPLAVFVYDIKTKQMVRKIEPVPPQPPFFTNISTQKRRVAHLSSGFLLH